ncbi:MAG: NnrU family protein [Rhodospirillaceae bacterium]
MDLMVLSVLVWLGVHVVVPETVRPALVAGFGLQRYIPVFAMSSLAAMTGMILAYREAPYIALWSPPPGASTAVAVLVALALMLLTLGITTANPAGPAGDAMTGMVLPTPGVVRITRHPLMSGIALWALAHLLVNGHLAALLLFGTIALTALNGMAAMDRRRRRALGPAWDDFAARTSRLPLAAILAGRNRLVLAELSWKPLVVAVVLFFVLLLSHQAVIGLPPYLPS